MTMLTLMYGVAKKDKFRNGNVSQIAKKIIEKMLKRHRWRVGKGARCTKVRKYRERKTEDWVEYKMHMISVIPVKLKGKVYKTVIRPAMLYGPETWATMKTQEKRIDVNEMRMLRGCAEQHAKTRSGTNTSEEQQEWCRLPKRSRRDD